MISKLRGDLNIYMKAKDIDSLNVIRGILNEINIREMKDIKITPEEITKVLRSEIKKRKEAIECFQKGNRPDLIDKENKEIKIIEKYLPQELSDEELFSLIQKVISSAENKDFGSIMKATVTAANGQADGKRISALVKKALEK